MCSSSTVSGKLRAMRRKSAAVMGRMQTCLHERAGLMQILIDATPLLLRSAGVKNYTYYWIQSLWERARNDRIVTLPSLNGCGPLTHEASIAGSALTFLHLGRVFAANRVPAVPLLRWTMPK